MTLVMPDLSMVPEPLRTVQVWVGFEGWLLTVTAYAALLARRVPNTKSPLPVKLKPSPPLSSSTRPDPLKPVTVPPTVYFEPPVIGQPDNASPPAHSAA